MTEEAANAASLPDPSRWGLEDTAAPYEKVNTVSSTGPPLRDVQKNVGTTLDESDDAVSCPDTPSEAFLKNAFATPIEEVENVITTLPLIVNFFRVLSS